MSRGARVQTAPRVRKFTPFVNRKAAAQVYAVSVFRSDVFPAEAFGRPKRQRQTIVTLADQEPSSGWMTPASGWRLRRGLWLKD